jgi:dTDP-4-amino-4,6-dideoxygalactose transaminase
MPKAIETIPHTNRIAAHRLDYLKSINESLDYPFQSEDGRDPSPAHKKLENTCRSFTGIKHWQFTNCGTDALQIAFHILCRLGDTVIVPAYGWRAITNAPQFVGLHVIYCDIDDTGNVDLDQLNQLIIQHKPAAVLVVHNFGTIVDVSKISDTCIFHGAKIIEDAAPSFVMNEPYSYTIGSKSDMVCFSFDFTKSPGCLGAGGGLATNDSILFNKIKTVCSHISSKYGIGTKSYLDTISAAVLNTDIKLIEKNNYRQRRVDIATYYINNLPYNYLNGENYIFHRFIILTDKHNKQEVINKFKSQKILAKSVFKANTELFPRANKFAETAIELPCHQFIDINDLDSRIKKIL